MGQILCIVINLSQCTSLLSNTRQRSINPLTVRGHCGAQRVKGCQVPMCARHVIVMKWGFCFVNLVHNVLMLLWSLMLRLHFIHFCSRLTTEWLITGSVIQQYLH
ncbi:hypothetical protein FKM82_001679 [Ascaphus truei]